MFWHGADVLSLTSRVCPAADTSDSLVCYSYITVYCGIHERIASVFHSRQWYN